MVIVDGKVLGCGVIVEAGNYFLLGRRFDGDGWCLPGGKVEEGEHFRVSAARELMEEAGVESTYMKYIGDIECSAKIKGELRDVYSQIYVCKGYQVDPKSFQPNREMLAFTWVNRNMLPEVLGEHSFITLFGPTKEALKLYQESILIQEDKK